MVLHSEPASMNIQMCSELHDIATKVAYHIHATGAIYRDGKPNSTLAESHGYAYK